MRPGPETLAAIERTLAERGVALRPDEIEELALAHPALLGWVRVAEELAEGEPAFVAPLPDRRGA
jgi:hypothetical protein